jgi:acetyltransferase-like isoleucine patch superfamily enzyme
MSELVASDRAPGLLLGPGVELPDDVILGGHVIIYGGTVVEPGCRIQDGAVIGKRRLVSPTARSGVGEAEAPTVLERGASVGCNAVIVAGAHLGPGAVAGDHSLIRERVAFAAGAVVGSGSGIGPGCQIGAGSRLMPGALLALDTVIEAGVFCGPRLIATNDPAMGRLGPGVVHPVTRLRRGCRIAANVTLLPNVEIGEDALVGAGSVVTKSVAPRTVVVGAPARFLRAVRDDELAAPPAG